MPQQSHKQEQVVPSQAMPCRNEAKGKGRRCQAKRCHAAAKPRARADGAKPSDATPSNIKPCEDRTLRMPRSLGTLRMRRHGAVIALSPYIALSHDVLVLWVLFVLVILCGMSFDLKHSVKVPYMFYLAEERE